VAAIIDGHGEVEYVEPGLVQLVDHEPHNPIVVLRDHADAVALAQASNKVLLEPRELETFVFDVQDFGHIAADHPPDVNANLLLLVKTHAGLLPCRPVPAPVGTATHELLPQNAWQPKRIRPPCQGWQYGNKRAEICQDELPRVYGPQDTHSTGSRGPRVLNAD
jgi:hypothetical protein